MASYPQPNIVSFRSGGVIAQGHAVKIDTTVSQVVECTSTTDKAIGVALHAASASGLAVEVALPGGGALAKAHTTITSGQQLCPYSDGTLEPVQAAGNRVVAVALDGAAAGDLFPVLVCLSQAYTTEA